MKLLTNCAAAAALLAGCATATPEPAAALGNVTLSPEVQAACAQEGGCALVTHTRLAQELAAAYQAGAAQGAQSCPRGGGI